jgi:hypothetical protein
LRILGVSNIDIPNQYHWRPRKEWEYPKGLQCKERGSFIWVMQDALEPWKRNGIT